MAKTRREQWKSDGWQALNSEREASQSGLCGRQLIELFDWLVLCPATYVGTKFTARYKRVVSGAANHARKAMTAWTAIKGTAYRLLLACFYCSSLCCLPLSAHSIARRPSAWSASFTTNNYHCLAPAQSSRLSRSLSVRVSEACLVSVAARGPPSCSCPPGHLLPHPPADKPKPFVFPSTSHPIIPFSAHPQRAYFPLVPITASISSRAAAFSSSFGRVCPRHAFVSVPPLKAPIGDRLSRSFPSSHRSQSVISVPPSKPLLTTFDSFLLEQSWRPQRQTPTL